MIKKKFFVLLGCLAMCFPRADAESHYLPEPSQHVEAIGLAMSLTDVSLNTDTDSGLTLKFTLEGSLEKGAKADIETVVLDDTVLLNYYTPCFPDLSDGSPVQFTMGFDAEILRYIQKERLNKIRLFITVTKDSRKVSDSWFEFDLPVELGSIVSPLPDVPEPKAVFEQDGLYFELLGMQVDRGLLILDMRVENRNSMEKKVQFMDGAINGVPLSCDQLTYFIGGNHTLPEGSQSRFQYGFFLYEYGEDGQRTRLLPYDLSEIQSVELFLVTEMEVAFAIP